LGDIQMSNDQNDCPPDCSCWSKAEVEGNYAVVGRSEDGRLCRGTNMFVHDGIGWIDADPGDFIYYFSTKEEALACALAEEEKQKALSQGRWLYQIRVLALEV
jgi:hypothetical protein